MKVFLSSVIRGFEDYRQAAAAALATLEHETIRAEDFGARSDPPRVACLEGVRESDVTILLLGSRYGDVQDSGVSATHEEYLEAKERGDVLVFVQQGVEREERQQQFVDEVRDYALGHSVVHFETPDDLRDKVLREIHRFVQQAPPPEPNVLHERAVEAVTPTQSTWEGPKVGVAVAGHSQMMLTPSQIEDRATARTLRTLSVQEGLLDEFLQVDPATRGGWLELRQDETSVGVHERSILKATLGLSTVTPRNSYGIGHNLIIEEELVGELTKVLGWAGRVLGAFDPTRRIRHIAVAVALINCGSVGWKTQAEHERSPNTMELGHSGTLQHLVIPDEPLIISRRVLDTTERQNTAQNLMILARRAFRGT